MTLTDLLSLAQTFLVPILGYGVYLLNDIRAQLVRLNGRVTRVETWTREHEKLDDERTETIRQQIRDCPTRTGNHG